MKYYLIGEKLMPCSAGETAGSGKQYAALLTSAEWADLRESFGMVIDVESSFEDWGETKAVVNIDSLTGSFCVPDRKDISGSEHRFSFALDEKGIVIIDDEGYAGELVETIARRKKWKRPSLERFIYELLELMIAGDLPMLEGIEKELDRAEAEILAGKLTDFPEELNAIRGSLLDMQIHYEQLIDLGHELEENENGFFGTDELRFFRLFTERVIRLQESVSALREYVVQLRDLVQTQLSIKQNKIMTLLTVITSIFLPLTLIAGWYGMNFRYMPELDKPYAYPIVIVVCIAIVAGCLIWFKKKKWL